ISDSSSWIIHSYLAYIVDGLKYLESLRFVLFDLTLQRLLRKFHRLVVHQHGLNPHHQQRVPQGFASRMHQWHGTYCFQRLDHGLHVRQRPGWLESGLVEQRLVVEEGGHVHRAGVNDGESEWVSGVIRLGSWGRRINVAERGPQARMRRQTS